MWAREGMVERWWRERKKREKRERKKEREKVGKRWDKAGAIVTEQNSPCTTIHSPTMHIARVLSSIHQLCTYKSSKAPKNACTLLIDLPSPGSRHTLFISGNQVCSLLTREGEGAGVHSGFNHLP